MDSIGTVPLRKDHILKNLDCGVPALNEFLLKYARQNQSKDAGRTFVISRDLQVLAYYTLVSSSVEFDLAPAPMKKGLARHPLPVVLMARLAIDQSLHRQGWGKALMRDAYRRVIAASEEIGIRALVVDAKDEEAVRFYEHMGLTRFESGSLRLFCLSSEIRVAVSEEEQDAPGSNRNQRR